MISIVSEIPGKYPIQKYHHIFIHSSLISMMMVDIIYLIIYYRVVSNSNRDAYIAAIIVIPHPNEINIFILLKRICIQTYYIL